MEAPDHYVVDIRRGYSTKGVDAVGTTWALAWHFAADGKADRVVNLSGDQHEMDAFTWANRCRASHFLKGPPMATLIKQPRIVDAAGTPPKTIREHVGRLNTATTAVSLARMSSPPGWAEPWQMPDFDEWTLVLSGSLVVEDDDGTHVAAAGETVHAPRGERVRYSTPHGAEYVAVCVPAFAPNLVRRDDA
jgi:quercetin dioxygenase-like cupin family protein